MATFNLKSILGKPLTAKVATKFYREASDNAKPYASVAAGQYMGNLYSWINPGPRTKSLWLMFYDTQNKPYYVRYSSNLVSATELKKQGIKDVEKETKEEKEKADLESKGAFKFYLEKYAPFLIAAVFLVPLGKKIIDKKL